MGALSWLHRQLAALAMLLPLVPCALHAGDLAVRVLDKAGNPLADAVVYAEPAGGQALPARAAQEATMDQAGKAFAPSVLVVQVGDRVRFPNSDDIRHHVYSFSDAKSFELPLYAGTPAEAIGFPMPGVVALGCNIHDWMRAHIVVLPSPYHALTDATGAGLIPGLPEGAWQLRAWHSGLPDPMPVAGPRIDSTAAPQTVEIRLEPKPQPRIRRAPGARRSDQY